MRIVYLFPTKLPSRKAHPIQFLNSAHAFARLGADVEIYIRAFRVPQEEVYAQYDLAPLPNFRIRTLFDSDGDPDPWRSPSLALRLAGRFLRPRNRGAYFYVRGRTPALNVLRALKQTAALMGARIVHEIHQINYLDMMGRLAHMPNVDELAVRRIRYENKAYRCAHGLIYISKVLRDLAHEKFTLDCPELIAPSGARLPDTGALAPIAGRPVEICYVGSLYEFQGIDILIEAIAQIPRARLVVLGEGGRGDPERVTAKAEALGLGDRIEFRGRVPHVEAMQTMREARIVAAPMTLPGRMTREQWCSPSKLPEYMASGAAIVATRLRGIEEVLRDGDNALLVEPNSAPELAAGIRRLLEDEPFAQRLANRAVADSKQYSFDERARRIMAFMRGL